MKLNKAEKALLQRLDAGASIYPRENRTTEGEDVSFHTFGKFVAAGFVEPLAGYYTISLMGRVRAMNDRAK
jgi:hypothetical protein